MRRDFLAPSTLTGDPFWAFARAMLRYRAHIALTLVMTVISALTLGIGLAGTQPVLKAILGQGGNLQTLAQNFNASVAKAAQSFGPIAHLSLSQATIDSLPSDPFRSLVDIMIVLIALTVIGATATFLHQYLSLTVVNQTVTAVRRKAYVSVLRSPLRTVISMGPTDAVARIINDSSQLANGLNVLLSKTLIQTSKGLAGFVAAFYFNWKVSLVALLVTPLLYTIIRKLGKRIRRAAGSALESQGELLAHSTESLQALRVVKASDAEVYESGRFHVINKRVMRELNRVRTARAIASPLTETLTLVLLCGMVLVVAKAILTRGLDPTDFILAVVSLAVAGAAFKPLTALVHDIQASTPAAERLRELICLPHEPGHARTAPRLAPHMRDIAFSHVTVTYPGRTVPALSDVSVAIPHGSRVAFVGPNGSGKTTALSLVNRMFDPDSGTVSIDGVNIANVHVRSLRRQIGVVTQETVLFKGTIRGNIAYGALGMARVVSEDDIIAAATQARAHEFISKLPLGYDTPVAEQGLSLSGGQRQRIAIARAILRDPRILILDEATSMVDAESESAIAAALAEFAKGRTTLIVAHRLSTVVNCDQIVVFDQGKIADIGTHEQLLSRCGVYQQLVKSQLM
ncbi:MAG: ABC transporter ATP-binding protein [Phycisphaerae bacterium]|jgi:subfamily B ATP-binding cassette protein MsbA